MPPATTAVAPAPAPRPALAQPGPPDPSRHDSIIVLGGLTWADFERILELRGDRPVPRLTYLEGRLELMSPSRSHESIKSVIGCLVEAWCVERGLDVTPYGSWLLKEEELERGVEPDECYVLGVEPEAAACPDLAIEVVWTSGGIDKLEVYRLLGVREVWFWEEGVIRLYLLRDERYEPIERSAVLPGIDVQQLAGFARVLPMTRAVREYRAALRAGE